MDPIADAARRRNVELQAAYAEIDRGVEVSRRVDDHGGVDDGGAGRLAV